MPISCVLAAVWVIGCGRGTALEGIYELSAWTANTVDCDSDGQPAFEQSLYSHFFVRGDRFFGEFFVNAVMCDDLASCRSMADEKNTLFIGDFLFDEGDDDGWVGARGSLSQDGDACTARLRVARLTGEAGVSVRIEEEAKTVTGVPLDSRGDCDFGAARARAADHPCESLVVVTGALVDEL
jgi:hypothetical protein